MTLRGMLFVLEGPDGVGKSTLAEQLYLKLSSLGLVCHLMSFPGKKHGTLGNHIYELHHKLEKYNIDSIHPASLQMLHIAAHIDEIENRIIPTLNRGESIILDRYWWSTWVYGSVSNINLQALEVMIESELEFWKDYLPTIGFLIDRNSSLRNDMSTTKWRKLRIAYHELIGEEKNKYPVKIIKNDKSPRVALEKILDVLNIKIVDSTIKISIREKPNSNWQNSQLTLGLRFDSGEHKEKEKIYTDLNKKPDYSDLLPIVPSEVFETYWRFAEERQNIFFRKFLGFPPPWTDDPILTKHKFTNVYRASDRVSQFLIKEVIYQGDQNPNELFFRIMLFKVFNRISTWKFLQDKLGKIRYDSYSFEKYDKLLTDALSKGKPIFSAAYIMPSGKKQFGHPKKHRNYLLLVEKMIEDEVPLQLSDAESMREAFHLIRSYPLMGDFLAYQYATDINYSDLTNFSESEFVIPGPGARNGIRKCFKDFGGLNEIDLIKLMQERQQIEFSRFGINFKSLWGRPLQLIDCQNLFCEVDKYTRVSHPHIKGKNNRVRIKQIYKPKPSKIDYWYPPKWKINSFIKKGEFYDSGTPRQNSK